MVDGFIQYHSNSTGRSVHAYWPTDGDWVLSPSLSAIQSVHTGMFQQTYGNVPTPPLAIVWVQSSNPTTAGIQQDTLSDAAIQQYRTLGDRLVEIAQMDNPPVEVGAIASADKVLNALVHYRMQPPEITWHGGDAIAMLWRLGATSYAITVTDGELGFVVRSERKTLRRQHSIPLNEVGRLVAQ